MNGLRTALSRFTALRSDHSHGDSHGDGSSSLSVGEGLGFAWFPWIGVLLGAFACTLYHPLGVFLLPADVALVVALGWQAFLGGFHAESGFVGLWRRPAAGTVGLVFALLFKYMLFRQFYPDTVWRLMLLSSITSFCTPAMVQTRIRGWAEVSIGPLVFTWLFWIVAVLLLVEPSIRSGVFFSFTDRSRAASGVILFAMVAQLFVAGHLSARGVPKSADGVFSASLIVDLAACAGFVCATHLFL